MATASISLDLRNFNQAIRDMNRYMTNDLAQRAYRHFERLTPRQSGNARRNTELRTTRTGWAILTNYDYAIVLDQGLYPRVPKRGTGKTQGGYSTQAPRGMSIPTVEFTERELAKQFRRYS